MYIYVYNDVNAFTFTREKSRLKQSLNQPITSNNLIIQFICEFRMYSLANWLI